MFVFTMNNEQSDCTVEQGIISPLSAQYGLVILPFILLNLSYFLFTDFIEKDLFPISSFSYNIYKFNSVSPPPPRTSPSSVNPVNTARNISGVQVGQNTILSHQISNQKSTL